MVVKCKSGAEMQQQPRAGPGRGCTGPAEEKLHIKIKWLQQWRMHQSCILMLHISKIFFVVRIYHKSKPRHMLVYKSKPIVDWHYNMSSPGSSCPAVRARCWSQCWGRPGAGARQCRPAQHLCVQHCVLLWSVGGIKCMSCGQSQHLTQQRENARLLTQADGHWIVHIGFNLHAI